jgi:acetolactate synthase-1/2/3 large subunit
VKHNFLIKDINDIAPVMKKAFHVAATGRPGPVLIDIPKDITATLNKFEYPEEVNIRSYNPVTKGHLGQIKKALKLLAEAQRPMVYTGGGVVLGNASVELTEFLQSLGLPTTSTLMGLGGYPATDRQSLGMLGMHGTYEANMAMQECDVLLAVGARFDDRVIGNIEHFLSRPRTIIHIDIDPSSISKRVQIDVPIVGDVKSVLTDLNDLVKSEKPVQNTAALAEWMETIKGWRAKKHSEFALDDKLIKPQQVIKTLHEVTNGDAFITSDVGQHQMWAAQYYPFDKPRRWINSGGLGTMGVGLPYAMGVQLAHPEAQVACITGEASIQMCIQELSTCQQYNLPIKVITLNNRYMGMVRQWQEFFYENRYSESYMKALPDFIKLAEAYGHIGIRVENPADVEDALKEAFSPKLKDRMVFMDFITDQTENVFPMVPNGKGLSEMITGKNS